MAGRLGLRGGIAARARPRPDRGALRRARGAVAAGRQGRFFDAAGEARGGGIWGDEAVRAVSRGVGGAPQGIAARPLRGAQADHRPEAADRHGQTAKGPGAGQGADRGAAGSDPWALADAVSDARSRGRDGSERPLDRSLKELGIEGRTLQPE